MNARLLLCLLVLDILWIYFIMNLTFSEMVVSIQNKPLQFRLLGALAAYACLYALAIMFLPKVTSDFEAFMLGFLVYGVYDSTNYATLSGWRLDVALLDSLWGGILFYLLRRLCFS